MTVKINPDKLQWHYVKLATGNDVVHFKSRADDMMVQFPDEETARIIAAAPAMLRFLQSCLRPNGPLNIDIERMLSFNRIELEGK